MVREGDLDRGAFFVVAGDATQHRGDLELARLSAGDAFGMVELIVGTSHAATITCGKRARPPRLTHARWEQLARAEPELPLELARRVLRATPAQEPAQPGAWVEVNNEGVVHRVPTGTPLFAVVYEV